MNKQVLIYAAIFLAGVALAERARSILPMGDKIKL